MRQKFDKEFGQIPYWTYTVISTRHLRKTFGKGGFIRAKLQRGYDCHLKDQS